MTDMVGQAFAAVLGAFVGSFLNVVVWRLPRGTFLAAGRRSHCPHCGALIPWRHNIPLLSWLFLRARAACCGKPIASRYPLVEALTALAFWALAAFPPSGLAPWPPAFAATGAFLLHAYLASVLIACAFIDIDHRLLPDRLTKPTMAVGLLGALFVPEAYGSLAVSGLPPQSQAFLFSLVGLASGIALTWGVRAGATRLFRQEAMGLGDVKLMGAIGAFVGWQDVLLTFFLGCALGAVIGLAYRAITGQLYICFGPFLVAGALATLFAGEQAHQFLFVTWPAWQHANPAGPFLLLGLAVATLVLLVVIVRRGRSP